jgi:hypothetical protein
MDPVPIFRRRSPVRHKEAGFLTFSGIAYAQFMPRLRAVDFVDFNVLLYPKFPTL